VAVKVINLMALSAQERSDAVNSFHREISLLSGLKHKHLLRIRDHFIDQQRMFIVMDYVDG